MTIKNETTQEESTRILAYVASRVLTETEMEQVAGGLKKAPGVTYPGVYGQGGGDGTDYDD